MTQIKWEKMDTFKEKKQEEFCQVKGPWKQNNKYSECQDLVLSCHSLQKGRNQGF